MSPERWRQIEQTYSDGLQLESENRTAFLARVCAGDPELQAEVRSLLQAEAQAIDFLQSPLAIDAGTFARVFLATDTRLPRIQEFVKTVETTRPGSSSVFFWLTIIGGAILVLLYAYAGLLITRYGEQTQIASRIPYLPLSFSFVTVAMILGLSRPDDWITRLGCTASILVGLRLVAMVIAQYRDFGGQFEYTVHKLLWMFDPWHLAFGYDFFYRVALPGFQHRFWGRLRPALYTISGLLSCVLVTFIVLSVIRRESFATDPAYGWIVNLYKLLFRSALWTTLETLSFAAMGAVVVVGFRRAQNVKQHRRLLWIMFGAVIGLCPYVAYTGVTFGAYALGLNPANLGPAWEWFRAACTLALVAIPFTLVYAVLKHQVLDVRVVIRRGLQHLLARRALQVVLLIPLLWFFAPFLMDPDTTLRNLALRNSFWVNLTVAVSIAVGLRYRRRLIDWVDRKFFREVYRQEAVLRGVLRDLRTTEPIGAVPMIVARKVEEALHPSSILILHRMKEADNVTEALCYGSPGVPREMLVGMFLSERPVEVRPRHLVLGHNEDDSRSTYLAVPIATHRQLIGLILLGEKRSEEPYTGSDLELLEGILDQMAILYENAWLRDRVEDDERLRRELIGKTSGVYSDLLRECPQCGLCFDALTRHCSVDSTLLETSLAVERTLIGRYQLDRRIATGGMAAIYEALDLKLERRVAVKLLRSFSGSGRFGTEVKAAARLNHPNIVAVYDSGRVNSEIGYLVMELVQGSTWRSELNRNGTIELTRLLRWLTQLLAGLEAAHEAQVVHRDLKPENVLISNVNRENESLKIADFGIAKLRDAPLAQTQTGMIIGTLAYMAPEQFSGNAADERADIFAVGVMAVEAITGFLPARQTNYGSVLIGRLDACNTAPAKFLRVLIKCLDDTPANRPRSVAELRTEFDNGLLSAAALP